MGLMFEFLKGEIKKRFMHLHIHSEYNYRCRDPRGRPSQVSAVDKEVNNISFESSLRHHKKAHRKSSLIIICHKKLVCCAAV